MKTASVTRYKHLDKSFAGFTVVCERGARGDYRGALMQLGAMPPMSPAAELVRNALNTVLGELVKCFHGPDAHRASTCPRCGWRFPIVEEEATLTQTSADPDLASDG